MGFAKTPCYTMKNSEKKAVVIYIYGSNFYFSVKNRFNVKLDVEKFCKKLIGNKELIKINYYIAPLNQKTHPKQYLEQQKFFDGLKKIDKLNIVLGRLENLEKRYKQGEIDKKGFLARVNGWLAYVMWGDTYRLRMNILKDVKRILKSRWKEGIEPSFREPQSHVLPIYYIHHNLT